MSTIWLIAAPYLFCLCLLGAWGLHRLALLSWLSETDRVRANEPDLNQRVLVQLPIFNEREVATRLIDAVARLEWPEIRIQVLDDSTDQTPVIVARRIDYWTQRGVAIEHIRREARVGYKAGALANGLALDDSEFIAIFDADFVPEPDFLLRIMSGFHTPKVGMVQARWGHINRDQNWLTRIQALMLDGHFVIEHTARFRSGRFFNFNGTAGVWRRTAIESAGGWSHDTVTEDLDLSYRAQLEGWSFVYMDRLVAPAEVPGTMRAFLAQQHRWAKGTAQTARKLVRRIAGSDFPLSVRSEAITHLTMVLAYPVVLGLAVLLPPSIAARAALRTTDLHWMDVFAVVATTVSIAWFYSEAIRRGGESIRRRWWEIPLAMSIGIGCSASQSLAVVEGLISNDATFVRTPKQGNAPAALTVPPTEPLRLLMTGGMALYYTAAVGWAVSEQYWLSLPFMLLFGTGFALSFLGLVLEGFRTVECSETALARPTSQPVGD